MTCYVILKIRKIVINLLDQMKTRKHVKSWEKMKKTIHWTVLVYIHASNMKGRKKWEREREREREREKQKEQNNILISRSNVCRKWAVDKIWNSYAPIHKTLRL